MLSSSSLLFLAAPEWGEHAGRACDAPW